MDTRRPLEAWEGALRLRASDVEAVAAFRHRLVDMTAGATDPASPEDQ